ncbi:MAG: hypothetical protein CXT78_15830 [Thaumarchaeota archaeon]|nr:MAG: hypothetical protein CXT78_15830 [Nitrososphaerota archaeon]
MTIDGVQSEDLVSYGNGEIILRDVISKRATHIPRKNIFTLDSKSFGIDELTIEKNAKGDIFLSKGVLSCGKNLYPFNRIKGIIRGGMLNSFEVTLEISEHSNLELEIRVENSQMLFKKFNELKSLERNNFEHTVMRDQINFVKDRLGLDRV